METSEDLILRLQDELGVPEEEILAAIEIVGPDEDKIREFVARNHTDKDEENEV